MTSLVDYRRVVAQYLETAADPAEFLSLLRWQIDQNHPLTERTTMPGHITTSAIVLSPDHKQVLLIDHIATGRWLQPGGHYEQAAKLYLSAQREAVEETGVSGLRLHRWHDEAADVPFAIDSQDVQGKQARGEKEHVHHDFQYLFIADPAKPLTAQEEEVRAAQWKPASELMEISPKAAIRLRQLAPVI